ncbi:hypothetical protein F0562_013255 [Nyssa sinensis]|uniref:KIB1-4 beta-propeller domain-containing protein n=1 Tax=Nyssa sinensis TaxID=561372 RepID=A0A5J4ZWW2_9ASTE|nr:hypothetical protein F0562_013255 [Nyssa sinensis]
MLSTAAVSWKEPNVECSIDIGLCPNIKYKHKTAQRRLTLFEDFVAFGGVCVSWRLVMAALKKDFNMLPRVPWLMLAEKDDGSNLRDFYCPMKCKNIYRSMLPKASGKRFFSSQGWLLTIAADHEVNLLHPLSRVQILLPNLTTFSNLEEMATHCTDKLYHNFIQKAVLSSSPSTTSDYAIMVIHGAISKLAFYRRGDNAWTTIETWLSAYSDVIYHEGRFYAIDCWGRIVVCDVNGSCPTRGQIMPVMPNEFTHSLEKLYLVESLGKLLIVLRQGVTTRDDYTHGTTRLRVFELNWEEVQSLGNRALFLGFNSSFSVEASNEIKANCIYFTDDCFEAYYSASFADEGAPNYHPEGGGKDMGIFNLSDGSIEPHFRGRSFDPLSPPMWVTPSF